MAETCLPAYSGQHPFLNYNELKKKKKSIPLGVLLICLARIVDFIRTELEQPLAQLFRSPIEPGICKLFTPHSGSR